MDSTLYDPSDPGFQADPYPVYARMREAGPVHCPPLRAARRQRGPGLDPARWEDCVGLLRDPRFSAQKTFLELLARGGAVKAKLQPLVRTYFGMMLFLDPPRSHPAAQPGEQGLHAAPRGAPAPAHRGDRDRAAGRRAPRRPPGPDRRPGRAAAHHRDRRAAGRPGRGPRAPEASGRTTRPCCSTAPCATTHMARGRAELPGAGRLPEGRHRGAAQGARGRPDQRAGGRPGGGRRPRRLRGARHLRPHPGAPATRPPPT